MATRSTVATLRHSEGAPIATISSVATAAFSSTYTTTSRTATATRSTATRRVAIGTADIAKANVAATLSTGFNTCSLVVTSLSIATFDDACIGQLVVRQSQQPGHI